ncbi:MAG: PadR family transcriptional regulator [Limnohabitans sp.]|nr:PadR family transcriptional regulator [Limnohabitans sp.]
MAFLICISEVGFTASVYFCIVMGNQLLFKGVLRPLVLSVLLQKESVHGYLLISRISEVSSGQLRITEGAVYPLLSKLEGEGIIKGEVEKGNSRGKKIIN